MQTDIYRVVEEDYDAVGASYHQMYDSAAECAQQLASFAKQLPPGASVLVVGGTFGECHYFIERGFAVTNIDISQVMLDYVAARHPAIVSVKANIRDYSGGPFAGVWACRSLIHIPPADLPATLLRIRDCLKDNGTLGALLFTADRQAVLEERMPDWLTKRPGIEYYRVVYSKEKLQELIMAAHLSIHHFEEGRDSDGDEWAYIEARRKS